MAHTSLNWYSGIHCKRQWMPMLESLQYVLPAHLKCLHPGVLSFTKYDTYYKQIYGCLPVDTKYHPHVV